VKFENWSPELDPFLKSGEVKLHEHLHLVRSKESTNPASLLKTKAVRKQALDEALKDVGPIKGNLLEVGAGDGWCSAHILSAYKPEKTFIMEIDEIAVEKLIPNTLSVFGVDTIDVTIVQGSFNKIPHNNFFDFIIAMGALHHSANLRVTFDTIFQALKPGGWLLAQEPSMDDDTPNSYFVNYGLEKKVFPEGIEMINADRSDIFYRNCEFRTAAYHAGFEIKLKKLVKKDQGNSSPSAESIFISCHKPIDLSLHESPTQW